MLVTNNTLQRKVRSMKEERDYHIRYLRAINNPIRRGILQALKEGNNTFSTLQAKINLDETSLKWHLSILENGSCIKKESNDTGIFYKLTKEGHVIDHL